MKNYWSTYWDNDGFLSVLFQANNMTEEIRWIQ
ncbi:hypothetical protein BIW11_02733 [Tropilaelaps mercedesae]|uniref:Uncharacterized protein n=1 Tax=Tropilaelaps mercedesae TaxID=418985 RepID=A0A1V9XYA3_9ACAR|nr:hypothetical protein BIW11_02733 [Tropilaelaps mercedesae]